MYLATGVLTHNDPYTAQGGHHKPALSQQASYPNTEISQCPNSVADVTMLFR